WSVVALDSLGIKSGSGVEKLPGVASVIPRAICVSRIRPAGPYIGRHVQKGLAFGTRYKPRGSPRIARDIVPAPRLDVDVLDEACANLVHAKVVPRTRQRHVGSPICTIKRSSR